MSSNENDNQISDLEEDMSSKIDDKKLTKCPVCFQDFTKRGWNSGNIKKHIDKHSTKSKLI
jgi:hypothetical protein